MKKHQSLTQAGIFLLIFGLSSLRAQALDSVTPLEPSLPEPTQRIEWIEWNGIRWTQQTVFERELPWKRGDSITASQLQIALDRLGNLPMLTEASASIVEKDGKKGVAFKLTERWTLKPVFAAAAAGRSFWVIGGISERNLFGRYLMAEALYQNFNGVHGGRLYFEEPRFLNTRTNLTVWLESMLRPRPFNVVQRTRARATLAVAQNNDTLTYGGSAEVFQDGFYPAQDGTQLEQNPYRGFFLEGIFKSGLVNRTRILRNGRSIEIRPTLGVVTPFDPAVYGQLLIEGLIFSKPHPRLNLIARSRIAWTSRVPRQMEYFIGGIDFFRGFPDNYVQSGAYALANLEARLVAFDHDWVAIVPFVFCDGMLSTDSDASRRAGASVGAGILLTSPMIADSEVRFDVSLPFKQPVGPAFGISTSVFY